jgi:hypothetical protein
MNHEDLEFLFITIIESDPKLKYEGIYPLISGMSLLL